MAVRGPAQGHEPAEAVGGQSLNLAERAALRFVQVIDQRAGRPNHQRLPVTIKGVQRAHAEVLFQRLPGGALFKAPIGQPADGSLRIRQAGVPFRQQQLGGRQASQLLHQLVQGVQLRGGELAGGDIRIGQAGLLPFTDHGRQIVVAPCFEHARLNDRAGGEDAHHLPRHQPLHQLIAHLLAERHLVAFGDQPGDVVFDGMIGYAGHRHALILAYRPAGEHQVQLRRCNLGVLIKRFVEIAQPEEENRIRMLALDIQILPARWGYFLGGQGMDDSRFVRRR